jgi:predicted RNA-binding protein YlxR (DUF448 family)
LLRFVASDGQLVLDSTRTLPGRGAWVHPDAACVAKAVRSRAFSRALRAPAALDLTAVEAIG